MSFFSRLFRKAPSPSPVPAATPSTPSAVDRAMADYAEEKALRSAIDAGDVQAVARLVVAGTSTKIRQAAAQTIEDPDLLRQLIRDVRGGNDKAVYKILTSKRDALVEQARKLEALQAEINAASADLERHSQRAYDALSSPRLDQYERRWEAVAAQADPELRGKVEQWIARSREIVAEPLRLAAAQAAKELAAANAAAEAQRQREERASAAPAVESEPVIEEQKPELTEQQQAEQQAVRQIGELIRKARAALSDGSSSRAAGVRRIIEEKLAAAPPLPAKMLSQLQLLDAQLDELKDWKSFSVAPKRAELIEEMELLVEATLEPLALADRVKSLQDEWRALGKGAGENHEADWQRFHAAAQKAYQPCAEYFAAQAVILEQNLQRREALLAKLTEFEAGYNWEQPDWRAVISTLRESKEQWRGCAPVDRRAGKEQQEKFATLTSSLQARVDAEHTHNLKQKESLVERAQALLATEDVRKAIDAIKKLQQEWQKVGAVPREVDQRLWGEFRQHCDAVFQKREQESAAFTAALENNKTQALALCEQVEKIAALEGPELLEGVRGLSELRNAFAALGEFPRAESRELHSRFERALDRCKASQSRQQAHDAERSWNDLFEAANHVRAYKLAVTRDQDAQQLDTLKQAAETFMASVQRWPKNGLNALKQAFAAEPSANLVANEAALKMLCIRAELFTDIPTPPEDQALRREYQLQRLVQNLGQGSKADETQLDGLVIEWVAAGPVEESVYQPLLRRFRHCRERGNSRN
ncbi:MAG: DUF349 domain-containing protein [Pseudomonadota bacterium]